MTKLEAALVTAVAKQHHLLAVDAAAWVTDVLDKGTSSPHFAAVQPAILEVLMPLWRQLQQLFTAVAPLLTEADTSKADDQ